MIDRDKRSKAKSMDPWETDEDGDYARCRAVVNPFLILMHLVPIYGLFTSFASVYSGHELGVTSSTGVPQQAIRTGDVGFLIQFFWIILFVLIVLV